MANQQAMQLGAQPAPYKRGEAYDPKSPNTYKLSRSKIELFMQCPRCFWVEARLRIKRPQGPPFQINKAIDTLLKKEFDTHRVKGKAHPLMETYKIDAIPFAHDLMDNWRENFVGVQHLHQPTNLLITGAVDDIWQYPNGELIVVDYKATSKANEVNIDAPWQISYKRQMEVYQWLLRQNDFPVSNTGYFVYANGRTDVKAFDAKLEFDVKIIPYEGSDSWVEPTIVKMKECLDGEMPEIGTAAMGGECDFCSYARQRAEVALKAMQQPRAQ